MSNFIDKVAEEGMRIVDFFLEGVLVGHKGPRTERKEQDTLGIDDAPLIVHVDLKNRKGSYVVCKADIRDGEVYIKSIEICFKDLYVQQIGGTGSHPLHFTLDILSGKIPAIVSIWSDDEELQRILRESGGRHECLQFVRGVTKLLINERFFVS